MNTMEAAEGLWDRELVTRALAYARPDPLTSDLVDLVRARLADLTDREFSAWASALPWPRFCTVVHVVTGVSQAELMTMGTIHE